MENEKIVELLKNEDFLKKIINLKTPEEVQKAFKVEGIDISIEEVGALGDIINAKISGENLDDKDLSNVSGGVSLLRATIGGGVIGLAAGTGIGLCLWGASKAKELIKSSKKVDVNVTIKNKK